MKVLHYSDGWSADFLRLYDQANVIAATGDLNEPDFAGLERFPVKKPIFGVHGNHDEGTDFEKIGITDLHNRTAKYGNEIWGGFGGCLQYKTGNPFLFTEEAAKEFADTFPYVDILLLHAGAAGLLDDENDDVHKGSENIRRYILDKKPKAVFCGHTHFNAETEIGPTKIFRTFGARLIELQIPGI
jgi:Icc-related predicted phosphoesterase